MANLIRWEPMGITSLRQAMDSLFEDAVVRPSRLWPAMRMEEPAVDMYQTDKDVVVKASMPGINADDVDISVTGDMLSISGETCEQQEVKEENYFRREMRCGTFSRTLQIPVAVNVDKSEAVFENGVLTLTMPKSEAAKPKKLAVTSGKAEGVAKKAAPKKAASKAKKPKAEPEV
jgi:HSP20 family protein